MGHRRRPLGRRRGLLLANPHFPWEGERRFWEAHLTVPGQLDIYGAQLSGLPGIGIGFTKEFGWTHTVSAGNRFTAYRLTLVPGSPTTYMYGDEQRPMSATDVTVDVLQPDGTVAPVTRTMCSSHYGPMLDFPGVGWTADTAITYRDANIDDDEFADQYFGMDNADDLDEFIAVHKKYQGVPLFNTIAVSKDGRAWYADTSATPNLSHEGDRRLRGVAQDRRRRGAGGRHRGRCSSTGPNPMSNGSMRRAPAIPGLVPYRDMPKIERNDYVFNANDSFWVPQREEVARRRLLAAARPPGDRPLTAHAGKRRRAQRHVRHRAVAAKTASSRSTSSPMPPSRTGATRRGELLDDVVARCQGVTNDRRARAPRRRGSRRAPLTSAPACAVLAAWDGVYDLDRAGAVVWREMMSGSSTRPNCASRDGVWAKPFDPKPVDTPNGLAPAPPDGPDPILDPGWSRADPPGGRAPRRRHARRRPVRPAQRHQSPDPRRQPLRRHDQRRGLQPVAGEHHRDDPQAQPRWWPGGRR